MDCRLLVIIGVLHMLQTLVTLREFPQHQLHDAASKFHIKKKLVEAVYLFFSLKSNMLTDMYSLYQYSFIYISLWRPTVLQCLAPILIKHT